MVLLYGSILVALLSLQQATERPNVQASPDQAEAELLQKCSELLRANSYTFTADGQLDPHLILAKQGTHAMPGKPESKPEEPGRPVEKTQPHATASAEPIDVDIKGEYQAGRPVRLASGDIVVFRTTGQQVAWRTSEDEPWQRLDPSTLAATGDVTAVESFDKVQALAIVPLPHELVQNLRGNLQSCTKREHDPGIFSGDKLVYDCTLKPEAVKKILGLQAGMQPTDRRFDGRDDREEDEQRPGSGRDPAERNEPGQQPGQQAGQQPGSQHGAMGMMGQPTCKVRVTCDDEKVEKIELFVYASDEQLAREPGARPIGEDAKEFGAGATTHIKYDISEINSTTVEVPEDLPTGGR